MYAAVSPVEEPVPCGETALSEGTAIALAKREGVYERHPKRGNPLLRSQFRAAVPPVEEPVACGETAL